jgi:metal-sulfur cluster biosynthetic enzyme
MTSRVALRAAESGRRRRPLVVLSSSPSIRRIASCASKLTILGKLQRTRWYVQAEGRRYFYNPTTMIDEDDVLEALSNVIDPELGLAFVDLGLVYGIEIDGGRVSVTYTLTTPACPIGPQVAEQMQEFIGELPGVEEVVPTMVFSPPWTPDKMSEDAKFALGY